MSTVAKFVTHDKEYGNIRFYVKAHKGKPEALSYHDLQWNTKSSYEEHQSQKNRGFLEFIGPELVQISMTIELSAYLGISPFKLHRDLRKLCYMGVPFEFYMGGRRVLKKNWFVLESVSASFKQISHNGRPASISVDIELKEYRVDPKKKTAATQVKDKNSKNNETDTTNNKKSTALDDAGFESYTVKKGDKLWGIAKKYYGSGLKYTKIYNANTDKISNPNLIIPGLVIKIPKK